MTKKAKQYLRKKRSSVKKRKKRQRKRCIQKKKVQRLVKELLLTALLFFVAFIIIQIWMFALPKVQDYSMLPTLNDNNRVFVNKHGSIRRFSLIYFKNRKTNQKEIRRVIGLPGESLSYIADNLYIDGNKVFERAIESSIKRANASDVTYTEDFDLLQVTGEAEIPEGHYFVLGDNRPYAIDSRDYGFIAETEIIGSVKVKILPLHELMYL